MYTRVVTFTAAKDIDGGIGYIRDTVAPVLRQQKGFRGTTASVDRSGGVLGVLSLWESEADRDASESAMAKAREEGLKIIGGQLSVEHFEEVLAELTGRPAVGSALLIQRVSMDPAKVDDNVEYFKREVLPAIKANSGLLSVRHMINRVTGDAIAGTLWTDEASMRAGADDADKRRKSAEGRVTFGEQSRREVVFVDLP